MPNDAQIESWDGLGGEHVLGVNCGNGAVSLAIRYLRGTEFARVLRHDVPDETATVTWAAVRSAPEPTSATTAGSSSPAPPGSSRTGGPGQILGHVT